MNVIKAEEGKIYRRKHDQMLFGDTIYLGIDYSTGVAREDLEEYYEQIDADIIAPINNE